MSEKKHPPEAPRKPPADFAEQVGRKAARKLKARRNATPGVWFGLGMMGLIGWSVVVPTLLGAALWIFTSLLLRLSLTLAGFYWVAGDDWRRLLACLLGFLLARLLVTRLTRPGQPAAGIATEEASHAP